MSTPDFSALVARHRAYFRTGATRSAQWREGQLTALRAMMTDRAKDFHAALARAATGESASYIEVVTGRMDMPAQLALAHQRLDAMYANG